MVTCDGCATPYHPSTHSHNMRTLCSDCVSLEAKSEGTIRGLRFRVAELEDQLRPTPALREMAPPTWLAQGLSRERSRFPMPEFLTKKS